MRASADFSVAPCLLRSLRLSQVLQAPLFGASILRTRLGSTSAWNPAAVPGVPFVGGFVKTGVMPIDASIADIGSAATVEIVRMSDLILLHPTLYPAEGRRHRWPALHSRTLETHNRILLQDLRYMLR